MGQVQECPILETQSRGGVAGAAAEMLQAASRTQLRLPGSRTGRRLTPPDGRGQILSPAKPAHPLTCGDADPPRSMRAGKGSLHCGRTAHAGLSEATAANRREQMAGCSFREPRGLPGATPPSQSSCGGGQWLPGNEPGAQVRGRSQLGREAGVVAG